MADSEPSLFKKIRLGLRLQDLGELSPAARSRERYKRAGFTALASVGTRALGMAVGLVSVPLMLHYLGPGQYGLWLTVSSFVALLGFADLGLGLGLLQGVAEANGKDDRELAREYVSSTFFMLVAVALAMGVAFVATYRLVPWADVFNLASPASASLAGLTIAVLVGVFLVGLPIGIVESVQTGYQEGFRNSLWQVVGATVSLVALMMALVADASLPVLALALTAGPVVGYVLNSSVLFRRRPWLIPSVRVATRATVIRVAKLGVLFFVMQIAWVISFQTDNIVIAHVLGVPAVTGFAVPMRLFFVIPTLSMFGLTALWPAYREAFTREDYAWVKKTYTRSLAIALGASVTLSVLLIASGRQVIHLWVGDSVKPTMGLLLALGAWAVVFVVVSVNSTLLAGANLIGFQAVLASVSAIANLVLSIVLARAIGIAGPAWASVVSLSVFSVLPGSFYLWRLLRRFDNKTGVQEPPDHDRAVRP